MKKILVIGELLWDLLPDGRKLGGAPANFAFRLNSLGYDTRLLTSVGNDSLGKEAIEILSTHDVNISFIQINENYPTGTVNVSFDSLKNPDYIINPNVAYDFIRLENEIIEFAKSADCIAFGTLVQRSSQSRAVIEEIIKNSVKAIKFLDINLRKNCYTRETVKSSISFTNILKINENEAFEVNNMFGLGADGLPGIGLSLTEKFNLRICLITLGEYGALIISDNNEINYSPGFKVKMVDPLGAGDAFSAAFIHSLLSGENLHQAIEQANKAGAMVVGQKGAMQEITVEDWKLFNYKQYERIYNNNLLKYLKAN